MTGEHKRQLRHLKRQQFVFSYSPFALSFRLGSFASHERWPLARKRLGMWSVSSEQAGRPQRGKSQQFPICLFWVYIFSAPKLSTKYYTGQTQAHIGMHLLLSSRPDRLHKPKFLFVERCTVQLVQRCIAQFVQRWTIQFKFHSIAGVWLHWGRERCRAVHWNWVCFWSCQQATLLKGCQICERGCQGAKCAPHNRWPLWECDQDQASHVLLICKCWHVGAHTEEGKEDRASRGPVFGASLK